LGDCYLWSAFSKLLKNPTFLDYFLNSISYVVVLTKTGWAAFWAIFSQTHLVTLRHDQLSWSRKNVPFDKKIRFSGFAAKAELRRKNIKTTKRGKVGSACRRRGADLCDRRAETDLKSDFA
jgi:hypothetical protein